jgi:hypothetical protein
MITKEKRKQQLYNELNNTFGSEFTKLIDPPKGVEIGERVLYKLTGTRKAKWKEITKKDIDAFHKIAVNIAAQSGGVASIVEPPTTSGLPCPRLVDITGWIEVAMPIPAKKYLVSDDLLPEPGFSIEWVLGTVFGPSDKQVVYIDFTHPKVKTVFSCDYDSEYEIYAEREMHSRLSAFLERKAQIIKRVESQPNILWAKLIQLDKSTFEQIKNKQ